MVPEQVWAWHCCSYCFHIVFVSWYFVLCFVFPSFEFSVVGWRSVNLALPFLNRENGDFSILMRDIYSWVDCFFWGFQAYDVTRFLEEHPGGDEVLLSATGMLGSLDLKVRALVGCYCRALFFSTFWYPSPTESQDDDHPGWQEENWLLLWYGSPIDVCVVWEQGRMQLMTLRMLATAAVQEQWWKITMWVMLIAPHFHQSQHTLQPSRLPTTLTRALSSSSRSCSSLCPLLF